MEDHNRFPEGSSLMFFQEHVGTVPTVRVRDFEEPAFVVLEIGHYQLFLKGLDVVDALVSSICAELSKAMTQRQLRAEEASDDLPF